jgi:hypothetical protein
VTEYRSEIRDSEIQAQEEKVAKGNYRKYLKRLILKRVRGFSEREVTFDFPVTALVGPKGSPRDYLPRSSRAHLGVSTLERLGCRAGTPNGGGKTTILGAAALVYKDVPPRRFFAKSGKYDASMKDWVIEPDSTDELIVGGNLVPAQA